MTAMRHHPESTHKVRVTEQPFRLRQVTGTQGAEDAELGAFDQDLELHRRRPREGLRALWAARPDGLVFTNTASDPLLSASLHTEDFKPVLASIELTCRFLDEGCVLRSPSAWRTRIVGRAQSWRQRGANTIWRTWTDSQRGGRLVSHPPS